MVNIGRISKIFLPSNVRKKLPDFLLKSGLTKVPYDNFSIFSLASFAVNLLVYLVLIFPRVVFDPVALIIYSLLFFVGFQFVLLFLLFLGLKTYYDVRIYSRTKEINRILPDFLEALRNNLAAGQSFNRALMNSLHPNFKVINEEIQIVAKKTSTGEEIEQALSEFAKKYDSPLVEESVDILVLALKGGANVVEMLDKLIESIRIDRELKEEVRISVASYIMFIGVISTVISPVLFALSLNLLNIFTSFTARLGTKQLGPLAVSHSAVSASDFIIFSRVAVVIIALFSGMIVGKLQKGSVKSYLPHIAGYILITIFVYEIARFGLTFIFSNML